MEWLNFIWEHFGPQYLAGVLAGIVILDKRGIVQRWFRARVETQQSERNRLSEDQQDLIERITAETERERQWRKADVAYYQAEIERLRGDLRDRDATIARLSEAAYLSERGNARLRHGLVNAYDYIAALRSHIRKLDQSVPPYEGWRDMLGVSNDLDEKLNELFGRGGD